MLTRGQVVQKLSPSSNVYVVVGDDGMKKVWKRIRKRHESDVYLYLSRKDPTIIPQLFEAAPDHILCELCGDTLHHLLLTNQPIDKKKCLQELATLVYRLHRAGVAHRDIKPENIVECRCDPDCAQCDRQYKLIDFGLSWWNTSRIAPIGRGAAISAYDVGTPTPPSNPSSGHATPQRTPQSSGHTTPTPQPTLPAVSRDDTVLEKEPFPLNALVDALRSRSASDEQYHYLTRSSTSTKRVGTPAYMPPEIIRGDKYNPFAADVWSLGVTFFKVLCGRDPWEVPRSSVRKLQIQQYADTLTGVSDHNMKLLMAQIATSPGVRVPGLLSMEAADLLLRMLTIDPQKRPTMEEIMRHVYFT